METMKKKFNFVYNRMMRIIYFLISKRTTICIKDLFRDENICKYWHPIVCVRYMYIEDFYGKNPQGKIIHNKSALPRHSMGKIEQNNMDFDRLIRSFETDGLKGKSYVLIDKDGVIIDGTHRIALCIWNNIETIPALTIPRRVRKISAKAVIDEYELESNEIREIEKCYSRIREKLGF